MLPAIVVVGYNRPESIKRLLQSICNAYYPEKQITLIVSLDYSEKTDEIEKIINGFSWNNGKLIIRKFSQKQGLKEHVLSCGDFVNEYEAVIVLEDDLVVSPDYYNYATQMLNFYADYDEICGVSLYRHSWNGYGNYEFLPQKNNFDVFMGQIGVSWGQCWTKKQWNSFRKWYEFHKEDEYLGDNIPWTINTWGNQSWAKFFYKYMVDNNLYYILPYTSLSTNFSEIGEHNSGEPSNTYQVMILEDVGQKYRIPKYDDAIKYDMFFERIFEKEIQIHGINGKDICVNLNGFKRNTESKRYLLTCKKYNEKHYLCSFGLRMRPIEANVLRNIPGDDIFLYDTNEWEKEEISNYKRTANKRIKYEIYGNPVQRLKAYCDEEKKELLKQNSNGNIHSLLKSTNEFNLVQNLLLEEIGKRRNDGTIWMFHQVYDDSCKFIDTEYAINPALFEQLVCKYISSGYRFKKISEIREFKNEKDICITFDDGYEGIYKYVYPICQKHNIPFALFQTVNFIGREGYINKSQLHELSKNELCSIGSHTFNHSYFRALNLENKRYEIIDSKKELESILECKVESFAYPYGSIAAVDYDSQIIVEEAGYKQAFSTIASYYSSELYDELRFFIPRININDHVAKLMIDQI